MDDKSDLAFIHETLRQEAMALLNQQHAITDKCGRALALGGTVLAASAAYGIAGKAPGASCCCAHFRLRWR